MSVTQKQIATELGISHQLVSFALTGNANVAAKTRDEIVATAARLGYRPNEVARTMVTGKSRVLGLVRSEQTEHGGWMLAGAIEAANEQGYMSKILFTPHNEVPSQVIDHFIEWRLAALIAVSIGPQTLNYLCEESKERQIPLAIIDNVPIDFRGVYATSDEYQGIYQVVEHLVNQGHRHLGFLGGEPQSSSSTQREAAFRQVLTGFGLPVRESWVLQSHWYKMPLIEAAVQSFLQGEMPSAIVCAGDPLAMAMIRGARAAGVQVPQQLSVTGFANFYLSAFADPPLTTVEQSFAQIGRLAVQALIARLARLEGQPTDEISEDSQQKIPTRLIVRGSTAPPNQTF